MIVGHTGVRIYLEINYKNLATTSKKFAVNEHSHSAHTFVALSSCPDLLVMRFQTWFYLALNGDAKHAPLQINRSFQGKKKPKQKLPSKMDCYVGRIHLKINKRNYCKKGTAVLLLKINFQKSWYIHFSWTFIQDVRGPNSSQGFFTEYIKIKIKINK